MANLEGANVYNLKNFLLFDNKVFFPSKNTNLILHLNVMYRLDFFNEDLKCIFRVIQKLQATPRWNEKQCLQERETHLVSSFIRNKGTKASIVVICIPFILLGISHILFLIVQRIKTTQYLRKKPVLVFILKTLIQKLCYHDTKIINVYTNLL